ncbi:oligosaccharide flippase family protein [Thermoleptolyngbya sp. C42_A2020_037]|uniref:oligosaccharide flippase family protein n=1 Tax=Thermoleptolyngbya sp. C42_A2020_037 TaxID=2747799 RepID=UPI0019FC9352|nr:oligosaccharide flippase family protein [Thermoleptolyngbya sp. C42_A2020_037]MBF2086139.1 oligosaccharide flippase family protein [Thermoleptolyngbya sp. C42_A2020_037]
MGKRLLGNSLSIFATRLTQSITTFALSAFIARVLGAYELGQYLLAFGYYFIFMSLASQGFKVLFTRELSRNPEKAPTYLVSGTLLQLLFSTIAYAVLVLVIYLLPYQDDTTLVCYVMGLTIFPFSLSNISESIFQAKEKMYLITATTVPIYILRLPLMIWAMQAGYGVMGLSLVIFLSEILILLFQWGLMLRSVIPCWRVDQAFIRQSVQSVRTFVAIEGVSVINARMQILILSVLGGEVIVGLYGAIMQLMQPFDILSTSLTVGVFPSMSKAVDLGFQRQQQLAEISIEMLLMVSLPLVTALIFFGRELLNLVYHRPDFGNAAVPLAIVSLGLIASSFIRPLSHLLVANRLERINMREVIVTTTLMGITGILLISQFQLMGAAVCVLLMRFISLGQYVYGVSFNLFSVRFWKILKRPLLITIQMTLVFWILENYVQEILRITIISTVIYFLLVGALAMFQAGGVRTIYAKLLHK